jgi:hypothetical protein
MTSFTEVVAQGARQVFAPREAYAERRSAILCRADTGAFIDAQNFRRDMSGALAKEGRRGNKK